MRRPSPPTRRYAPTVGDEILSSPTRSVGAAESGKRQYGVIVTENSSGHVAA